jgi:hypothetical protein
LGDCCLTSRNQYFNYIRGENKLANKISVDVRVGSALGLAYGWSHKLTEENDVIMDSHTV